MSVSSATYDRSTADLLRKERERAEAREEKITKHYEAKLKKEKEKYTNNVSALEERYEGHLESTKAKQDELYTDQDYKHKREIEELKNTYNKQLQKLRYDNDLRSHRLSESYERDKKISDQISQDRFDNLNKKYTDNLERSRDGYTNVIGKNKEGYQEALKKQKQEMAESNYRNKQQVSDNFRNQLGSAQKNFDNYREHTNKKSEYDNRRSNDRMRQVTDNHNRYVNDLRERSLDSQNDLREDFKAALQDQKLDYIDQFARERDRIYSEVRKRQENEVEYLQGKVSDLERQNQRDKIKTDKQANRKIHNLEKRNQRAAKSYHQAQQRFINDVREERAKDRAEDFAHWSGITSKATKNYHEKLGMTERVLREHYNDEIDRLNHQRIRDKSTADLKVQLTNQTNQRDIKRVIANRNEQLRILKDKYNDDMNKMRDSMKDEKRATINKLHDMLATSTHEHKSKMLDMQGQYLERMDDLAFQKDREKRIMAETYGRLSREKNKSKNFETENIKSIYEDKIAKMKKSYEKQLNAMSDIHAEQMDQAYEHMRRDKEYINRKA